MSKYYVESGQIKTVLEAEGPMDACVKATVAYFPEITKGKRDIATTRVATIYVVSEKGFPNDRFPFVIDTSEPVYSKASVFRAIKEVYR
jgi:hypothetical protein